MTEDLVHRLLAAIESDAAEAEQRLAVLLDLATNPPQRRPRLRACVEAWPGCDDGDYDPRCCRWPKSCSCAVYDDEHVKSEELEKLSPWTFTAQGSEAAKTLRRCEADRRTVERHRAGGLTLSVANGEHHICVHCQRVMPCPDLLDRCSAYGIDTQETT